MNEPSEEALCELVAIILPIAKAWCQREKPEDFILRFEMLEEVGITSTEMIAGLLGIVNLLQETIHHVFGVDPEETFTRTTVVNQMQWDALRSENG